MGEHADDGDREDEKPSVPSADDSPDEREDSADETAGARDEQSRNTERKSGTDEETADEERDDVDEPGDVPASAADDAGAAEDAAEDVDSDESADVADDGAPADDPEEDPGIAQHEPMESAPPAEEWLEEHGGEDEAPGMTEEEMAALDASTDAKPGADSVADGEADDDSDQTPADQDGDADEADDGGQDGDDADEPSIAFDAANHDEIPDKPSVDEDGVATPSDDDAVEADATEAADHAADDDDVAEASPPVSTSDPGKNAPAGMGKPAAAGGGGGGGGGGAVEAATNQAKGAFPDFDGDMAPDDQEQPLTEHIEEMTRRFLVVALVMGLVASVALLWADDMINFLWYSFLGPDDGTCPGPTCPLQWRPHVYHPLSLLLARLKMAALVGFVAGLPIAVYQTYRFMRPGLYPHERRYYLAAVPTSLVLAMTGVAFAYYVVLPSLFIYFSAYSTQAAELAFALSDTFNLMVMMLGFFAVIFQIPLLVMLAIMMGVVTRRWLEQRRIYFWTGFGGVAFFFSPDPTGMAPLLVALTMIALFEGTLLLLRWTERSVALFSAETMANNRPYAWALAAFAGYVVSAAPVPEGYFGSLPPVVVQTLADYGYVGFTPAIIAGGIVLVFEILGWIARRIGAGRGARQGLQVRLAFIRVRPYVWLLAIVVGYMGSPDPVLLDVFREVAYSPLVAVGTTAGLIALWEGVRLVLSYVRPN